MSVSCGKGLYAAEWGSKQLKWTVSSGTWAVSGRKLAVSSGPHLRKYVSSKSSSPPKLQPPSL